MATLRVPGTQEVTAGKDSLEGTRDWGMAVSLAKTFRIDRARAAGKEPAETGDVDAGDVMEVELEGGIRLWTTLAQFEEDFGQRVRGDEGVITVPAELPLGGPTRGWGSWALKGLRLFHVDLPELTAREVVEKIEERLEPGPGLYRCAPGETLALEPAEARQVRTDKPILLFLHGTASSAAGSFGELWNEDNRGLRRDLFAYCDDQVYAFQHFTLSKSPLANAVELLGALPAGARLHLVSHSRGGMVGELLCRATGDDRDAFDATDRDIFRDREGNDYGADREALTELNRLLREKRPRVERFVRVACPVRGTTLASERLDRWLSILVNLAGQVPSFKGNPVYSLLTDFLLAVVKERTDPRAIPGVEAMMPASPLVSLLNRPGVAVEADLSVVAGDVEASSLLGRLKTLIPDLYYRGDHDLVVDTKSMFGGAERPRGARSFFDQGPDVNHFSYFRNERTARLVFAGLTRAEGSDAGFTPIEAPRAAPSAPARRSAAPLPVVFVVPGIMGSHLSVGGDRIWLDPGDLVLGRFAKLSVDAADVVAEAPVGLAYADLIEYLGETHEVIPFPFDWRKPIREEALRLGDAVAAKIDAAERANQPVRILAHSMGGLVARVMIALRRDAWDRLCRHSGGRLLMLGTPNGGSYIIPRLLVGQEKILRQLALLDLAHSSEELLRLIVRFPGVLDMLPTAGNDFFSPDVWKDLAARDGKGWAVPDREDLDRARERRAVLDQSPVDPARMLYVAGKAPATPVGMEVDLTAPEGKRIRFLATGRGDGRVPWETGIPRGVRTWYMDAEHGNLADHQPAFPALLDLLEKGTTERLPTAPPVVERGTEAPFPLAPDVVDTYPDRGELMSTAVGGRRSARPPQRRLPVSVRVTHGNLRFTELPVAVGHYQGDAFVSAEDYLDRRLGGMLRRSDRLGLYPGPLLSSEVFWNSDPQATPPGAIVAGLGRVGELTAAGLRRTLTRALLGYALAEAERRPAGSPVSASIATLLIGTGGGGLTVEESVTAILHAVHRANQALEQAKLDHRVTIDRVEFVELWQDRAIQAARALNQVSRDPVLRDHLECEATVKEVPGGKHRVFYHEAAGWWDRLQILGARDGTLRFSAVTRRARAELSLLPTQRQLADQFIAQAVATVQTNRDVVRTLFEMLLPNELKEQAPERRAQILLVNAEAARYPWELLEDRWGDSNRPMAVEAGLIRQLETAEHRRQPIMSSLKTALVVGDPEGPFTPLPGAANEARHVADLLEREGFAVTRRVREHAGSILAALHAQEYRILHLAGHGVYEYPVDSGEVPCECCAQKVEKKTVTGMVLGDNAFLTPADVEQMRRVPEVVFLNCCHLGRIEEGKPDTDRSRHNRLAANLAAEFIEMGVRAVVAAGWAVDDGAAKTFARCFYEELLRGRGFGAAVLAARRETYERHATVNTWGAYQCYGDPDFRLDPSLEAPAEEGEGVNLTLPEELVAELENVACEASTASAEEARRLAGGLDRLLAQTEKDRPAWLENATVRAAFGRAFGEVDRFGDAVDHYRETLASEKGNYPVAAVEQWANLTCRWALERARQEAAGDAQKVAPPPVEAVREAIRHLETLVELLPTSERWSLLAGAHKRLALLTTGDERKKALRAMASGYEKACKHAEGQESAPILNWLMSRVVLGWIEPRKRPATEELARWVDKAEALVPLRERAEPSFWNLVAAADGLVVRRLASNELEGRGEEVLAAYRKAADRAVSPRELRSVLEQLDFLAEMAGADGMPAEVLRQRATVVEVRDALKK